METFLIRALQLILSLSILVIVHEGGHLIDIDFNVILNTVKDLVYIHIDAPRFFTTFRMTIEYKY